MMPWHGLLSTAVIVVALAMLLLVVVQHQWPPALRLWATAVTHLEHALHVNDYAPAICTALPPRVGVSDHQMLATEVVVVLGYKVFGDGVPSPLLHLRLAAGANLWEK